MKTTTLIFKCQRATGVDDFNDPVYEDYNVCVDGCLIAPVTEPMTRAENQALQQGKNQVRIHLPKTFTGDVSNSRVEWDGIVWRVDSDSTCFMNENCPTQWNRYFRAEANYE